MQITDTITDTIKDFDVAKVGDRVEQLGQTAVDNYSETSDRVIDMVVDTNKRVVDVVVANATKVTDAVEPPFADRFPTPAEAGQRYLDAVERAADFNRDLSRRIVDLVPVGA